MELEQDQVYDGASAHLNGVCILRRVGTAHPIVATCSNKVGRAHPTRLSLSIRCRSWRCCSLLSRNSYTHPNPTWKHLGFRCRSHRRSAPHHVDRENQKRGVVLSFLGWLCSLAPPVCWPRNRRHAAAKAAQCQAAADRRRQDGQVRLRHRLCPGAALRQGQEQGRQGPPRSGLAGDRPPVQPAVPRPT